MKYHNTPEGPRPCRAEKGLCPYGRAGGEHYGTQREAQVAYEAKMTEAFGTTRTLGKGERLRQETYHQGDRLLQGGKTILAAGKAWAGRQWEQMKPYVKKASADQAATVATARLVGPALRREQRQEAFTLGRAGLEVGLAKGLRRLLDFKSKAQVAFKNFLTLADSSVQERAADLMATREASLVRQATLAQQVRQARPQRVTPAAPFLT